MSTPRPSDLPLTFHNPPGWPEPTDEWIAAHQGWEPDASWTPDPSVPPRPSGWVFWGRNTEVWNRMTAPARAALNGQLRIAAIIGALGIVASIVVSAIGSMFGGWYGVFAIAILYPLALLALYPFRRRQIDKAAHARVVEAAAEQRRLADTFVPAPASTAAGDGTTTGHDAPAAQAPNWDALVAGDAEDGTRVGVAPVSKRTRIIIGVAGFALVAAVFAILIPGVIAGNDKFVGFEVRDASQAEGEAASAAFTEAGGWVWVVTLDRECKQGTPEATVDFASTDSGDTEETRTFALEGVADAEQPLVIDGEGLPPYAVLTKVACVA